MKLLNTLIKVNPYHLVFFQTFFKYRDTFCHKNRLFLSKRHGQLGNSLREKHLQIKVHI